MDGNVVRSSSNTWGKIGIILLYLFLTELILLFFSGMGIIFILYGYFFVAAFEWAFGYNFAKMGFFKNAPAGIISLMPLSIIISMIIMGIWYISREGFEITINDYDIDIIVNQLGWYLVTWIIINIPMLIAYFVTLVKLNNKSTAKQQVELKKEQENAVKGSQKTA